MHTDLCVCALASQQAIATRVVVVMHHREVTKTSATARLLELAIDRVEFHVRGELDAPVEVAGLDDPARRAVVLFPADDAVLLDAAFVAADPRPVTLVVPDGNWRQASRIPKREPALAALPRVRLPDDAPTRYRLRAEPKAGGLATFEAVARALGVLEGPELRARLEQLFDAMVERTLSTRGR
ncbi:MAG: DTW domain-containing protein [Deltaproteobacteria bacterium]|nr:DTW domain-containing protein [Deltaproteobacteria bacterium]MCB9788017.1 DTW domain-containing protein [Deltaproteobacteria bacterium]